MFRKARFAMLVTMVIVAGPVIARTTTQGPTYPASVQAYVQNVVALHSFRAGSAGPLITVFLDPNCYYCHKFYRQALPYLRHGRLRLRIIPVAILKGSSLPKAVAILAASSPTGALATNEDKFNVGTEEGGIVPPTSLPSRTIADVQRATTFLEQTTGGYTPTIIAQRHGGLYVYKGLPTGGVTYILKNWK